MEAGPAALDVDGALAAIHALAGVDDPAARAALVSYLDAEPAVAAAASEALGACGRAALDVCVAALRQPDRIRFAALALARIGPDGRAAVALWRAIPHASPAARVAIAAALHRGPRQAPAALGNWLRDETDDRVTLVLADLVGRLPAGTPDAPTLTRLWDLARTSASPFIRALATWSAAAHAPSISPAAASPARTVPTPPRTDARAAGSPPPDVARLDAIVGHAVDLLADPIAGPALVACVARRSGPLQPLVDGFAPRTGLDPSSDLLDGLGAPRSPTDPSSRAGRADATDSSAAASPSPNTGRSVDGGGHDR